MPSDKEPESDLRSEVHKTIDARVHAFQSVSSELDPLVDDNEKRAIRVGDIKAGRNRQKNIDRSLLLTLVRTESAILSTQKVVAGEFILIYGCLKSMLYLSERAEPEILEKATSNLEAHLSQAFAELESLLPSKQQKEFIDKVLKAGEQSLREAEDRDERGSRATKW